MKSKLIALVVLLALFAAISVQAQDEKKPAKFTAEYQLEKGKSSGYLIIKSKMAEKHYIYSLTQKKIPPPTRFKVTESKAFKIDGVFKANKKPTVIEKDEVFKKRIEKHYGEVYFLAPITISGDDLTKAEISVQVIGQVCSEENCTLLRDKLVAKFGGYLKIEKKKNKK